MKNIATLVSEEAVKLLEFLNNEHIPGEIETHIEKSGLEISEIFVEDSSYDAACNAAERWQAGLVAQEADKKSKMHCPKCGSQHLVPVEDDKFMLIFQCKDCGYQII